MVSTGSLIVVATFVSMPDRSYRRLYFFLCRRLLRPVGEVFEWARDQPPFGVRYRVLWVDGYHRTRKSTFQNLP